MSRHAYHDHLRQIPLFEDLDNEHLDLLAKASTELDIRAGTTLMSQGSASREMVIVVDGTLEVTEGGEHIADIGPGGFAGEMGLLAHTQRAAAVTAKTDVRILHIDGRSFELVLEEAPTIAVKMLPIVASRVIEANARHTD